MKPRTRSVWAVLAVVAIALAIAGQRQLMLQQYVLDALLLFAIAVVLFLRAVARREDEPILWPGNAATVDDASWVTLTSDRARKVLLGAAALLAAIAFFSLAKNRFTWRGVLCWWGAVLAWLLVVWQVRADRPLGLWLSVRRLRNASALNHVLQHGRITLQSDWTTLVLLCILAISVFFHVYRIASIPAEPQSDHVEASLDVQDILDGQYRIFFPRNTGREATQFYLTAALSHVFGYGFTTLKLTMALVGMLNVIPMYFLGKELLDKRFGLLAAFFMAISYWHVIISRIGWRIVLASLWTTVTLCFILRAFRTRRRNDYLLTGLSLGMGLYGYMSFRITPLLLIVLCGLKLLLDREPDFRIGQFFSNVGCMIVTSVLVFLPMLRYMYDEPRMLWYRVLTRTSDLERGIERSAPAVFVDNVKRALLMFNWSGGTVWVESIPGRPVLDYISAGLFVLGAAYVLYLLLVRRSRLALYLLVAVFVLLLPSTLSIAFPNENPSNLRASGVIPVMVLLVALPLYLVARLVVRALRGGTGVLLVAVLGGLLLWRAAQLNFQMYFIEYDQQYRRAAWNASDMARVIRGFADSMSGSIYDAYIIGTPYWVAHNAVGLLLKDIRWNNLLNQVQDAQSHLAEAHNHLYIFNPSNVEAETWLRERYPHGTLMRFQAFVPDKDFMIFIVLVQPEFE